MTTPPTRRDGADVVLTVRVQPRASRDEWVVDGDRLRLRITAPPVDGAANDHLIRFVARSFGVANGRVDIVRGLTGRDKTLRVTAPQVIPHAVLLVFQRIELEKPLEN